MTEPPGSPNGSELERLASNVVRNFEQGDTYDRALDELLDYLSKDENWKRTYKERLRDVLGAAFATAEADLENLITLRTIADIAQATAVNVDDLLQKGKTKGSGNATMNSSMPDTPSPNPDGNDDAERRHREMMDLLMKILRRSRRANININKNVNYGRGGSGGGRGRKPGSAGPVPGASPDSSSDSTANASQPPWLKEFLETLKNMRGGMSAAEFEQVMEAVVAGARASNEVPEEVLDQLRELMEKMRNAENNQEKMTKEIRKIRRAVKKLHESSHADKGHGHESQESEEHHGHGDGHHTSTVSFASGAYTAPKGARDGLPAAGGSHSQRWLSEALGAPSAAHGHDHAHDDHKKAEEKQAEAKKEESVKKEEEKKDDKKKAA